MKNSYESSDNASENPELIQAEGLDKSLRANIGEALGKAVEIQKGVEKIKKENLELYERAKSLREKAASIIRQIKKTAEWVALLSGLIIAADVADYPLTRYQVEEKADAHGKIIFQHEDEETSYILDYLSGKTEMRESDRRELELGLVRNQIKLNHLSSLKNPETMSEEL